VPDSGEAARADQQNSRAGQGPPIADSSHTTWARSSLTATIRGTAIGFLCAFDPDRRPGFHARQHVIPFARGRETDPGGQIRFCDELATQAYINAFLKGVEQGKGKGQQKTKQAAASALCLRGQAGAF
jgi:hypothetical protein